MNKLNSNETSDIDVIATLKIVWKEKIKILISIFLCMLISLIYLYVAPDSYKFSTNIAPTNSGYFLKYKDINDTLFEINNYYVEKNRTDEKKISNESLKIKTSDIILNNRNIFDMFLEEFNDYNEVKEVLKSDPIVQSSLKNLKDKEKDDKLASLAKLMTIDAAIDNDNIRIINFKWSEAERGKILLRKAVKLTLLNLKKRISNYLLQIANAKMNNNKRRIESKEIELKLAIQKQTDLISKKIIILIEQSNIAKTLGIEKNQLKNIYINNITQYPIYLRGFKALDKEISLLKSRSENEIILMSDQASKIKYELMELKTNVVSKQLLRASDKINKDSYKNWVNYDENMINIKFNKNAKLAILISILAGLVLGSLFILILDAFNKHGRQQV